MSTKISVPKQKVAGFCRRNRIRRRFFKDDPYSNRLNADGRSCHGAR